MANEANSSLDTTGTLDTDSTSNNAADSSALEVIDPSVVDAAIDASTVSDPTFFETAVNFMQDGGTFMYIILIFLVLGLALVIERYIYLTLVKAKNRKTWNNLFPLLSQNKFKQALEFAKSDNSAVSRMVVYGLSRSAYSRRSEDIETAMDEGLMEIVPRLEARTPYIATLANISTLLGLLGTIIGLIQAFTAVASADPAEKADLLSASISVAMNTTAFGLIAAIPLLIAFSLLQAKTSQIVDSLEMAGVKFLNIFRQAHANADQKKDAAS